MNPTSLAQTATAKRSLLLPVAVAILAAASYAAGVVTPLVLGTTTIQSSGPAAVVPTQTRPVHVEYRIEHGPTEFDLP